MVAPCGRSSSWRKFRAGVLLVVGAKEHGQLLGSVCVHTVGLGHLGMAGRVACVLERASGRWAPPGKAHFLEVEESFQKR